MSMAHGEGWTWARAARMLASAPPRLDALSSPAVRESARGEGAAGAVLRLRQRVGEVVAARLETGQAAA